MEHASKLDVAVSITPTQICELRLALDQAVADSGVPKLPSWYLKLPMSERGQVVILSRLASQ